ncbi:surface glycoprotein [Natrarchaeobius sp. A-rgal3]|uniref:surface glycoprotein n=1 Tax=Natrarchaeobius versutus TaxID=1679078 RepID=UPI00350EF26E
MTRDDITYREKGRAAFLAAIMVLSVVAMSTALVGSAAALDTADIEVGDGDVVLGDDVEGEQTEYTIDVTVIDDEAEVESAVIDFSDAGNIDLSNVDDADVVFEDDVGDDIDVTSVNVQADSIEFSADATTFSDGDTPTVTINNIVNPDAGDHDVTVEFGDTEDNTASDTASFSTTEAEEDNFEVSELEAPPVAEQGDTITVSALVENPAEEEATETVDYRLDDTTSTFEDNEEEVTLGAGENTTVEFDVSIPSGQATGQTDHGIFASEGGSAEGTIDIANSDNTAFITGDLRDDAGERVDNASDIPIRVYYDGGSEEIDESPIYVGGSNDEYTQEVPIVGAETDYTVEVNATEAEEVTGTPFSSFARTAPVEAGSTERFDVRLVRQIVPGDIDVDPESSTALATGDDEAEFTVSVVDDDEGDAFEGATIEVEDQGDNINWDSTTVDTDENGEAVFTASSDVIQSADVTFTETSEDLEVDATVNFILDGEGEIDGIVRSGQDRLEGAQVYTFNQDQFFDEAYEWQVNSEHDIQFYRVVDADSGEAVDILDSATEYRVAIQEGEEENVRITNVPALNASDGSVGSGFAVDSREVSAENSVAIGVVPHEAGNYTLQQSATAPNATTGSSDGDSVFVNEDADSESFSNVTHSLENFETTQDLTYSEAEDITDLIRDASDYDGITMVSETDAFGDYYLNGLHTDGQLGVDYTVVAQATGYTTEYREVGATEDGLVWHDNDGDNFNLNEIDVEPGYVNITNVGLYENGDVAEFDNQTDEHYQQVPRDGSVDVLDVVTRYNEHSDSTEAEVEISVADTYFEGEFIDVDGGEIVESDDGEVTINTGEDGQATVYLETDLNGTSSHTSIDAVLTNDGSATDSTNKHFVGVVAYEEGSISGIVTNDENDPIPQSVVFVEQFSDLDGNSYAIEPTENLQGYSEQQVLDAEFQIIQTDADGNETATANVTGEELSAYDFSDFASVSLVGGDAATLLTFPSEQDGEAQYTLPAVPAQSEFVGGQFNGVDYNTIRGYQLETGENGAGSASDVRPGFTVEGNIVIVDADPITDDPDNGDDNGDEPSEVNEEYIDELSGEDGNIAGAELEQAIEDFFALDEVNGPTLEAVIQLFFE